MSFRIVIAAEQACVAATGGEAEPTVEVVSRAKALNTLPKHVASRTLDRVDWDGARLIKGDVGVGVDTLKNQDGGELQVHGSAGLIQTLLKHNLVDELRLMIFPVALGGGKRLFADGTVPAGLSLASSSTTSAGVLILTYQRDGDVRVGSVALD